LKTFVKILKIVVPIGVGVYLTWYFFSGMTDAELKQTQNAFSQADYVWIALSLLAAFLSHLSRAYRWLFLLEPMGYRPSLKNAYHAVMSGYVINYTVPRSGEFARAGLLTTYEKVPFEKGFGTIVVERVIDVIMLAIVVFISGLLQVNADEVNAITTQDENGWGSHMVIWCILGGIFLLGITGLVLYLKNQRIRNFVNEKLRGFWEGLRSVWTMKKKWAFMGHTVFIWVCYVGMIWISAMAFPETSSMPIGCIFAGFVAGAVSIAAVPGGMGLYPLWISQVLIIYNIDFKAFGIFIWVIQTGLIVVLGLLSLFLIQRQPKLADRINAAS